MPRTSTPSRTEEVEMSVDAIETRQVTRKEKFEAEGRAISQQVKDIDWLLNELSNGRENAEETELYKGFLDRIKGVAEDYARLNPDIED